MISEVAEDDWPATAGLAVIVILESEDNTTDPDDEKADDVDDDAEDAMVMDDGPTKLQVVLPVDGGDICTMLVES